MLTAAPAQADAVHVVGRGQTLFYIAKQYRTTPDAIRAANGLRPNQLIHPGLSLTIPGAKSDPRQAAARAKDAKESKDKVAPGAKDKADKAAKAKSKEKEKETEKDTKLAKAKDAKDPKGAKLAKDPKDAKLAKGAKTGKDAKDAKKVEPALSGSFAARPKKPGFVTMMRGTEKLDAQLLSRGQLNRAALPGLTKILRHVASDSKKAVDPRLAYLIGIVSDHFGGRTVHVVSGYRPFSKRQYTPHSNHNLGRAMDFSVEGVPNTVLRDYCRTLRDAGVGYYPNSTFVHLDVRTGKAYWVDYAGPGEAPQYGGRVKPKVDETARDVESGEESGSTGTQAEPKQPADSKSDTAGSATPKPPERKAPGLKTPTRKKADSPIPGEGVSEDPYP